jgi:hypothetical protein
MERPRVALSNAERQARWRERQRAKNAGTDADPVEQPLAIPTPVTLADFVKDRGPELVEAFDWMQDQLNLPVEQFFDPKHDAQAIDWTHNLIRDLSIALETVTATLSEYQIAMIDREIERLKEEGASDPAKLDANLDAVVRFKALRQELERTHRLNLRNYH